MADFTPTNSLEIVLRKVLQDKTTPLWSFYTPLAAAQLFIIAKAYPELDGSDEVAPDGGNPAVAVLSTEKSRWIGVYTARERALRAMDEFKISPAEFTCLGAQGHGLLGYLATLDAELWINAGLPECQYHLDGDMVAILLSRPEPPPPGPPGQMIRVDRDAEAPGFFAPLRDFLARQPEVRAVWIFEKTEAGGPICYDIGVVAREPTDDEILGKVGTAAEALTPVEIEVEAVMLMADDASFAKLARDQPPFYRAPGFLAEAGD